MIPFGQRLVQKKVPSLSNLVKMTMQLQVEIFFKGVKQCSRLKILPTATVAMIRYLSFEENLLGKVKLANPVNTIMIKINESKYTLSFPLQAMLL